MAFSSLSSLCGGMAWSPRREDIPSPSQPLCQHSWPRWKMDLQNAERGAGSPLFLLPLMWPRLAWCSLIELLLPQHKGQPCFTTSFTVRLESWAWVLVKWPVQPWPWKYPIQPSTRSLLSILRRWRHIMTRVCLPAQRGAMRPTPDHDTGKAETCA